MESPSLKALLTAARDSRTAPETPPSVPSTTDLPRECLSPEAVRAISDILDDVLFQASIFDNLSKAGPEGPTEGEDGASK